MIKKIKWNNHPSLGNLELDFTMKDGMPYKTIVLAGENGTGKTTVLETLAGFLNLSSFEPFEYIEYEVDGNTYKLEPSNTNTNLGFHKRTNLQTREVREVHTNRNNDSQKIQSDIEDLRYYGVCYTKARSGFHTDTIIFSKTEQLDKDKYEIDTNDDFTSIKQLIVDISSQDNSEWAKQSDKLEGDIQEKRKYFNENCRLSRFKKAFNSFFDELEFSNVDENDPREKKIMFKKHNSFISIDDLSTGEKQIVFRGAHLLRNSRSIPGGIVLVDEPELSMHPRWQKKILKYYTDLFTNNGMQTVQMIMATHSSYVIQEALKKQEEILVIVLQDKDGKIKVNKIVAPGVLPIITPAETNYMAFLVPTIDYHIELYGWIQRKNGDLSVKKCDEYIKNHKLYDNSRHSKASEFINKDGHATNYYTLPTYIRNAIDHPDSTCSYTDEELETSIELLIELCKEI